MPPPLNLINYLIELFQALFKFIFKLCQCNHLPNSNNKPENKLLDKIKCYSISVLKNEKASEDEKEKIVNISDKFKIHQQKLDRMEKKIDLMEQKLDKFFDLICLMNKQLNK